MEEYRIRSKSDLMREKKKLLNDIKQSGVSIKRNAKDSFMPMRLTPSGKSKVDVNKLLAYTVLAYKGIVFANKIRQFLTRGKKAKLRRR